MNNTQRESENLTATRARPDTTAGTGFLRWTFSVLGAGLLGVGLIVIGLGGLGLAIFGVLTKRDWLFGLGGGLASVGLVTVPVLLPSELGGLGGADLAPHSTRHSSGLLLIVSILGAVVLGCALVLLKAGPMAYVTGMPIPILIAFGARMASSR